MLRASALVMFSVNWFKLSLERDANRCARWGEMAASLALEIKQPIAAAITSEKPAGLNAQLPISARRCQQHSDPELSRGGHF